ncbi:ABC transporter substrate-binding protein [Halobacillus salinarum]|uniref:ABC transporter substrate-binding protein n=1 Tax=Halobacillus salinarum TaxID=2932257 RepID=A0ABY4ENL1_9BACI|nr:ABC transporter substrate-binding protein [Halobacillus salinarum]UOQ45423.1 ABC transporter substrate-binding protein [Halobacillus salinarum]
MKKIASLFLITALMLIATACSENSSSEGKSGPVHITMSDYFTNEQPNKALTDLISQFEESHPDIKVDRTTVPYDQFLPTTLRQAKTDSLPTVLLVDNLNIPAMVEAGALTPLSDIADIDTSKYLEGPISTVTYNDKLYGLPFGSNDLAIFYNKDLLKKAGVEPPKTFDELITASKKLHQGSTYGIAFSAPSNQQATWQFAPFLWGKGGSLLDIASDESVDALKVWQTLVEEGGASKSVVNFSQTQVYNEFAAKRAAMMVMGPWMIPSLEGTDIDYGIVPLPTEKAGEKPISPIGGEDLTITSSATKAEKEAAWTFIEWIQDEDRLPEVTKTFGYIPAYKPAYDVFVEKYPEFDVFAEELKSAKALTEDAGAKFPEVSDHISQTIQQVLSGSADAEKAAKENQQKIEETMDK